MFSVPQNGDHSDRSLFSNGPERAPTFMCTGITLSRHSLPPLSSITLEHHAPARRTSSIDSQGDSMKKQQKGFSLIELLIVVAIILIIAAIAIPNLIKSKMAANESGAAGTVRTINTSEA